MAKTNYTIENVYEPGYQSFIRSPTSPYLKESDSPYLGSQGMIQANKIGLTTDPSVANQIAALSTALNQGVSVMEIGTLSPQVFETIPKQHFHEMRRKAKLAEAQLTLHAPIQGTDPSGFGQRGYEEANRLSVERQLKDVIDKAAILDEKGNMPITIHGSNSAGSTFKMVNGEKKTEQMIAVDRDTGQLVPIKDEMKFYAHPQVDESTKRVTSLGFEKVYTPEKLLEMQNDTKWDDSMQKIEFEREAAEKALKDIDPTVQYGILTEQLNQDTPEVNYAKNKVYFAQEHLSEASRAVQAEFSRAYKIAKMMDDKEQMEKLDKISEDYQKELGVKKGEIVPPEYYVPSNQSVALGHLVKKLRRGIKTPEQFVSIEDFSVDKASDTFANVAMYSYNKKGEKAPALSIENLYQEMGFSQGQDLANLVEKSRKKFEDKLRNEKNISESKARQISDKLIGVTFDVGHLNISRKYGFNEKDLVKEAEAVKKYVNKVHLTDNFGFTDSHLPPGMGNVPIQALMEAIGKKGKDAIKINEVGGWINYFKSSPYPQLLEAFGSPIYSSGRGPYWSQAGGFQQSYLETYGQILPQTNYQTFGAGFSQLPQSLGGSAGQSDRGRMSSGGF